MLNIKNFLTVLICSVSVSYSAHAEEFSHKDIIEFARSFVSNEINHLLASPAVGRTEIQVSKLDPRLKVKPCEKDIGARMPSKHNGRNFNLEIHCQSSQPWQIYIPIKIRTMIPVVVANESIDKNTMLDRNNIITVYKDRRRVHGEVLSDITELIGTKAKRNLSLGAKVTKRNVCFVCKGDDVTIIAKSNDFMIKTAGIALKDGAIGDKVRVKNKHSNKTITASVQSINNVVINL